MSEAPQDVAVFGSSEPGPDDPLYRRARRLGGLLAAAGHTVITGGYGGVMEAASRGATEAGGRAVGVTCRVFTGRRPNPFLSEEICTADLFERTRRLVEDAQAYIVLPGKSGTLAELALLWALHRAGCLDERPVILLGASWESFLSSLEQGEMLEAAQRQHTQVVSTPEAALDELRRRLPPGDSGA